MCMVCQVRGCTEVWWHGVSGGCSYGGCFVVGGLPGAYLRGEKKALLHGSPGDVGDSEAR